MRIYVAASWRTPQQPHVVATLRAAGHDVYDFRNPPSQAGFGWEEINGGWQSWTPQEFITALDHPLARAGFRSDMQALDQADVVVLVQPSGRSAALEFGWACGRGKVSVALLAPGQEPELMLRMADYLTDSLDNVVALLSNDARLREICPAGRKVW